MTPFDRYAPAIAAFNAGLLGLAVYFGYFVISGKNPMTPELYGPLVFSVDAEIWVAGQVLGSGLSVAGATMRGWWGCLTVVIGCFISFAFYSFLAIAAMYAAQGTLVQGACIFLTSPAAVLSAIIAAKGMRDGRKQ